MNNFSSSFDSNLNVVIKKYEEFIDTLALESTKDKANYYFSRKPLISKVCPRYVSSSLNTAWEYLSLKKYNEAENIFEEILSKSENYSAVIGLSKIYEDTDSFNRAIIFLQSFEKTFEGTSSEYDLKFRLAELYVKNSEFGKAKEIYYLLLNAKPTRRLELLANTRIALFNDGTIDNYVSGSDYDKYSVLKKLNSQAYHYYSIPLMIDLSTSLEEDYRTFLQYFENDLVVKDEMSSYAVYKISEYMLNNLDYVNARKMAGLALRYKGNANLLKLTEEHYKKTEWFFRNAENILTETRFELN
jgi:tetratricopeptide (TPR) repeat protein